MFEGLFMVFLAAYVGYVISDYLQFKREAESYDAARRSERNE